MLPLFMLGMLLIANMLVIGALMLFFGLFSGRHHQH